MIRKIRNILNNKEQTQANLYDLQIASSTNTKATNHQTSKSNSGSPASYLKKKIRSTKSWVKLPKNSKLFQETESAYETVTSLEPANHEFESYTRCTRNQNSNQINIGYGQMNKLSKSPLVPKHGILLKHSTLNSNNYNPSLIKQPTDLYENNLLSKIFEKLGKSSIDSPANIPILCVSTFSINDPKWMQLSNRFSSCGINVRLIEIQKGVPVNALFYLSNLDLIYVKTADDLEGYVPRDCCKPISCIDSPHINNNNNNISNKNQNAYLQNKTETCFKPVQKLSDTDTFNTNSDDKSANDSIKYHSLSLESDYDDLIETNDCKGVKFEKNQKQIYKQIINPDCYSYDTSQESPQELNGQQISLTNTDYSLYKYRDSGYRSEIENNMTNFSSNNYKLADDYEEAIPISPEKSLKNINKCLLNMQSRSRLPISIRSNLNLTLMDDQSNQNYIKNNINKIDPNFYLNPTHKSPFTTNNNLRMSARNISPKLKKNSEFKRTNIRRSLDSYLSNSNNDSSCRLPSYYAVSIDLEENFKNNSNSKNAIKQQNNLYPDLDLNKIELDSLNDAQNQQRKEIIRLQNSGNLDKIWTIILKHDARNLQEISVTPGMLVLVIKEFNDLLYVKLIGFDNSSLSLSQQCGIIPRSCAVDLQEIIYNSNKSLDNIEFLNRRKSQITAL